MSITRWKKQNGLWQRTEYSASYRPERKRDFESFMYFLMTTDLMNSNDLNSSFIVLLSLMLRQSAPHYVCPPVSTHGRWTAAAYTITQYFSHYPTTKILFRLMFALTLPYPEGQYIAPHTQMPLQLNYVSHVSVPFCEYKVRWWLTADCVQTL